jgi:hypothetical protein
LRFSLQGNFYLLKYKEKAGRKSNRSPAFLDSKNPIQANRGDLTELNIDKMVD